MAEYYVGTLSGTSADGIDVVLVDFAAQTPKLIAARTAPLPAAVRHEIRALAVPGDDEIERLGRLDVTLGRLIATAVNDLLTAAGIASGDVVAVGSHGQTLRHRPEADPPFTLQVGDPNTIAVLTGIATVADFRRMDMALGGQGAPLAPAFHAAVFRTEGCDRAVLNLGGIANLTLLPGDPARPVTGFDTGPGNGLLDEWVQQHRGERYDDRGAWAAQGRILPDLLEQLLSHPYFARPAPKSTGREEFNLACLRERADLTGFEPPDVQATLAELTAVTLSHCLQALLPDCRELYACGGGVHNDHLLARIAHHLEGVAVDDTAALGIHPDWVEGFVFAWLARLRWHGLRPGLRDITGAHDDPVAGGLCLPPA
jgi:anhydro-N-acetylmuramic acid kinase